ncbi:MAG: YggT family protein [Treponema sp.]|nr:YggT family protein [Treponema sp.]
MIMNIISFVSTIVSFYTLILFVRVILTWVPSLEYSKFGRILASICDPYLNLFKKIRFLRVGTLDFTPMVAMGVLVLVSSILQSIIRTQRVSVGIILATIVSLCWSIIHTIFVVLIIVLLVRLIVSIFNKDSSPIWNQIDRIVSPVAYNVTKKIFPKKFIKYQTVLIFTIFALIICYIILEILLLGVIANLFIKLPF